MKDWSKPLVMLISTCQSVPGSGTIRLILVAPYGKRECRTYSKYYSLELSLYLRILALQRWFICLCNVIISQCLISSYNAVLLTISVHERKKYGPCNAVPIICRPMYTVEVYRQRCCCVCCRLLPSTYKESLEFSAIINK